jgi:SprT protein
MTSVESIKTAIEASVHHYVDMANEKLGADLSYPEITYKVKGGVGGRAYGYRKVDFNMGLIVDNMSEYLNHVVPHEVAHLVVEKMFGTEYTFTRTGKPRRVSHGTKFKMVMRTFGIYRTSYSTHNMDTSKVKKSRATAKVACKCTGCGWMGHIGKVRASKMAKGLATYSHKCGYGRKAPIELVK